MILRLQGSITSIDGPNAVIALEDGQMLTIPLRELTQKPQVGDTFTVTIMPEAESKLETDALARSVLSQLIVDVPVTQENPNQKAEDHS